MEPRKAALREHIITDIELTVTNDGNGSQCGLSYLERVFAGRTHDLMAFVRAASYYDAMRVVDECQPATGPEIQEAAERLLAYYEEHARECDEGTA